MLFRPTIMLLLGTALVWLAYDVWAVSHNYEWTISFNLWQIARYTDYGPPITAAFFFLLGHVIFPNKADK